MEKTLISPKLKDLDEGDVHLANLSAYAKHLVSMDDPDKAARNAELLYLTVIDAFQQAGITNVQWSPNLILEIGSREYEVGASRVIDLGVMKERYGVYEFLLDTCIASCYVSHHRSTSMTSNRVKRIVD